MESDLWRGFAAIADTGSFTAAANVLPISQSGLSQQMQRLESLVGVDLLDRSTRNVSLSDSGARLLPLVRDLLDAEQRVLDAAGREASQRSVTTVKIHVAEDATGSLLIGIIDRLRGAIVDVRVEVHHVSVAAQVDTLSYVGGCEALIERTPTAASFGAGRRTVLRDEPMCVVLPSDGDWPATMSLEDASSLNLRAMTFLPQEWIEWLPLLAGSGVVEDESVMVVSSFRSAIHGVSLDDIGCVAPLSIAEAMTDIGCEIVQFSDAPVASLDLVTINDDPVLDQLHAVAAVTIEIDEAVEELA